MKNRCTDEELKEICKKHHSYSSVLKELGLIPAGGNFHVLKNRIKNLQIDVSHFLGRGHLKGKTHNFTPLKPLVEILLDGVSYQSNRLRKRLIKEKYFESKCYGCNNVEWLERPIPLELEHKNGNHNDNRIENLTLLCPNCHAFTPSYRGKNKKKEISSFPRVLELGRQEALKKLCPKGRIGSIPISGTKKCVDCNVGVSVGRTRCRRCAGLKSQKLKIEWLPTQELIRMVNETSYCAVARKLGVSDNAIRKRIRLHPI